jgi:hypothetical protein
MCSCSCRSSLLQATKPSTEKAPIERCTPHRLYYTDLNLEVPVLRRHSALVIRGSATFIRISATIERVLQQDTKGAPHMVNRRGLTT